MTPAARLLAAMRRHAGGVTVITTNTAAGPVGFCATSVTTVSLDPAIVCFTVSSGSPSGQVWRDASRGIVHLLHHDQADVARVFATRGADRFGGSVPWRRGAHGLPLLDGVAAWLLVSVRQRVVAGDHTLVLCDVEDSGETDALTHPLVHHGGSYRRWREEACASCRA